MGPLQQSDHVVRKSPNWRANEARGHVKQRNSNLVALYHVIAQLQRAISLVWKVLLKVFSLFFFLTTVVITEAISQRPAILQRGMLATAPTSVKAVPRLSEDKAAIELPL